MIPFIKGSTGKAAQFVGKQKGLIPIPLENLRTHVLIPTIVHVQYTHAIPLYAGGGSE